jgi:hypothetical protein
MPLVPDADLFAFFWTTAVVVFGSKAQVQSNTRRIPMKYDLQEVPDAQLTQPQKDYLKPLDAQLEAMNYRPECTFRAANYGQNLMRRYSNPADPASCEVTIVEVRAKVGNAETVRNANTVSFTSRLSDGRRLITRNMPLKSVMDQLPNHIMQEAPNTTALAALKRRHDARATQLGAALPPPHGTQEIFNEVQREHERFSAHQLEKGIFKLTEDGASYQITNKAINRGIVNFFNPFGSRISIPQTLFTALVGAVLPLFGILKLAPLVAANASGLSFGFFSAPQVAIITCYALAGTLIGLSGGPSNYAWIMLVTYAPAHFVAAWTFGWLPYSTLAHLVSHFVKQARQRRALVLQTPAAPPQSTRHDP